MRRFSSNYSYLDVARELDSESSTDEIANFRKNKRNPSQEQIEKITKVPIQKRLTGSGSIVSSWGGFSTGDDTTTFDTQKLRDTLLRNPISYRYCIDLPREALYNNWHIVTADGQPPNNEGLRGILYWKSLFEASPEQTNLDELFIFADQYYRLFGEVALELRYARSPLLKLMGFNSGEMLKHIDLISPMLMPQSDGVQRDEKTGEIKAFKIYDASGNLTEITKPDEVRRIIFFHNQPPNENRGVSRLRPLMSLLDGYDDLRELETMMMEQLAMPVELYTIDEDGLTAIQVDKIRDDLETEIENMREAYRRFLIVNKRVEFKLVGAEGKNLDVHVFSDKLKGDIYQGLSIPLPYIEAEGSTKSTVEVQHLHHLRSQHMAQDQAFARKLGVQYIFPIILREMGIDVRLTPTLYFPQPYTAHDVLAQSVADRNYIETIGDPAIRRVMEREGFTELAGDKRPQPQEKTNERNNETMKMAYEYINGHGNTHSVTDEILNERDVIAGRNR